MKIYGIFANSVSSTQQAHAKGRNVAKRHLLWHAGNLRTSSSGFDSPKILSQCKNTIPHNQKTMKIQKPHSNVLMILAATAAALFLNSCAGVGSGNTTALLTAAGFRARTPQTPKQQQLYASLPPYQVERATIKGKGVFYVYKDENAGIAYVGREPEYQRYQQLAIQQQIAQNYYMAAQMDSAAAWGWYGAWGPRAFWW
jgi:hypothetical protein